MRHKKGNGYRLEVSNGCTSSSWARDMREEGVMVIKVIRNAALREVEKRPETSEIRTKPLLQIIEEM